MSKSSEEKIFSKESKIDTINFESENISKDWNFLSNRINAEIIKNIWGKDSYYKFLLNYDSQFLDGYAALEQARELIIK